MSRILADEEYWPWKKGSREDKITLSDESLSGRLKPFKKEIGTMPTCVSPMHYVTIEFRLLGENAEDRAIEVQGAHRFLYGVEHWIEGVDQHLENREEGELLKLILDADSAAHVAFHLLPEDKVDKQLMLELKVVQVVKAEPREVVKALAASVRCCDHCGSH